MDKKSYKLYWTDPPSIHICLSAVSAIDTSGVSFFKDLRKTMEQKGVEASINKLLLLLYKFIARYLTKYEHSVPIEPIDKTSLKIELDESKRVFHEIRNENY